jgi:hypothetical protein
MEPEAHLQDREAQRAEHAAIDERIRQEVDGMVVAAAEKREAAFDQFRRPTAGGARCAAAEVGVR